MLNWFNTNKDQLYSEPRVNSYICARLVLARSKMEKDAQGKATNQKCRIKNSILNYNDEIISPPSTTIATKKEKLHLPRDLSNNTKEKNE